MRRSGDLERMFDRTPVRSCTPSRRQNHDTFEQMFECVSGKDYRRATDHRSSRSRRGEVMSPGDAEGSGPLAGVSDFPDGPPDETGLTPRQHRVLDVIRDSVERRGYPPSMREIGEQVGLTSTSSVAHQLTTLQKKGYLRRDPNRPRAVEVRIPGEVAGTSTSEPRGAPAQNAHASRHPSTRPRAATRARPPPTSRSSAASPPVARSSPSRPSRTCSHSPATLSAKAPCSC